MIFDSLIAKSRMKFMQPHLAVQNGGSGGSSALFYQCIEISTFRAQFILPRDRNARLTGKNGYSLSMHHEEVEIWPLIQTSFLTRASLKGNLNLSVVSSFWFGFFNSLLFIIFFPSFPFFSINQIIDFRTVFLEDFILFVCLVSIKTSVFKMIISSQRKINKMGCIYT